MIATTTSTARTWIDFTTQDTFTVAEVAAAEGCHPRTIVRLLKDPRKPFGKTVYRIGRSYRIPRDAVAHFHRWARVNGELIEPELAVEQIPVAAGARAA